MVAPRATEGPKLKFVVSENFNYDAEDTERASQTWRLILSSFGQRPLLVCRLVSKDFEFAGRTLTQEPGLSVIDGKDSSLQNPAAPDSICGGSATGAAVAVSASLADLALATDTVGNLRVPAACCGVIGVRATTGCLDGTGVVTVSDTLDSIGFMVKDPSLLGHVGDILKLPGKKDWRGGVVKIYLARDLFEHWKGQEGFQLYAAIAKACLQWAGPEQVEEFDLSQFLGSNAGEWSDLAGKGGNIYEGLRMAALQIGAYEFSQRQKNWNVSEQLRSTANSQMKGQGEVSQDQYKKAIKFRKQIQEAFKAGIREDKLVICPLLLRNPVSREAGADEVESFECELQRLCALSSLVGCPQVNFPVRDGSENLLSVSVMSLNKSDRWLLAITRKIIEMVSKMQDLGQDTEPIHKPNGTLKNTNGHNTNSHGKESPDSEAENFKNLGNKMYKEKKFEQAVAAYTEAIKRQPKAVFYSNRAQAFSNLMRFEAAEADCTSALFLEGVNAKALLRRGFARKGLNKLHDAKKDFEQVLAIEPNNRQARSELKDLAERLQMASV